MPYVPRSLFVSSLQADMFQQAEHYRRRQNMLAGGQRQPKIFVQAGVRLIAILNMAFAATALVVLAV